MPDLAQSLQQAGSLLRIEGLPATVSPGQTVRASLGPPLTALEFVEIQPSAIDVNFIAKEVVFTKQNFAAAGFVEDPNITKVLPLFNLAAVPPAVDASGVPGLIGKLRGTIPVAVPTTTAPQLTVVWSVEDDAGAVLAEGAEYLAPGGLNAPTLDLIFLPAFTLFDGTVPPPAGRRVFAQVTLQAGGQNWAGQIGPARVVVPVIPFPKVMALALDTEFQGAALIMVPDVSAINGIDHIRTLLQPVRNAIGTLTSVARFAEMLVGINVLSSILDATNIVFSKANPANNLNDITLIQRAWYENDTEAEDELSAFVYIAPPRNAVELFNARNLSTSEGKFTVSTGTEFVALCRSLHSAAPTVTPGGASLVVDNPPAGGALWWSITSFGDEVSSVRFV